MKLCSLTKRKTLHGESVFKQQLKTSYLLWNSYSRTISSTDKPSESCFSRRNHSWCDMSSSFMV